MTLPTFCDAVKIGGDTEGVEILTASTPLTFCRPVMFACRLATA